jgi:hypothetical protein
MADGWDPAKVYQPANCRKPPPHNFEAFRHPADGRVWYCCKVTKKLDDGREIRCVYEVREDKFGEKARNHKHQLPICGFPTGKQMDGLQFGNKLTSLVANAATDLGWSLNSVASQSFQDMVAGLLDTLDGQFLEAAFALTQEGRCKMRRSMTDAVSKDFSDEIECSEVMYFDNLFSELFPGRSKMLVRPENSADDCVTDLHEANLLDFPDIHYCMTTDVAPAEVADDEEATEQEVPRDNHGPFLNALVVLQDLALNLKIDKGAIGDQFRAWIFDAIDSNEIRTRYDASAAEFWRTLAGDPHWDKLSQLARIILSAPASEAVCERNFSLRKRMVQRTSVRSRPDLLDAPCHRKF